MSNQPDRTPSFASDRPDLAMYAALAGRAPSVEVAPATAEKPQGWLRRQYDRLAKWIDASANFDTAAAAWFTRVLNRASEAKSRLSRDAAGTVPTPATPPLPAVERPVELRVVAPPVEHADATDRIVGPRLAA